MRFNGLTFALYIVYYAVWLSVLQLKNALEDTTNNMVQYYLKTFTTVENKHADI